MKQHSKAVMIETDKAMAGALDLLHAQVEPLRRSVRSNRQVHLIPTT